MTIEVSLTDNYEFQFSPPTLEIEVYQNIRNILSDMFFSVPFMREYGLNPEYLDDPIQKSQVLSKADIIKQIKRYEPRARVVSVNMEGDLLEGKSIPRVRIELND